VELVSDLMANTKKSSQPPHANPGRLYQQLARSLIATIDSGAYRVGDRLPAERELAVEYDMSRPTVREAIIALEVQGLVEVRVGSGVYVKRKPGEKDATGFNITAFELTEARLMFEGEAAALAATLITDEELDQLDVLVKRIDRENRIAGANDQADRDFHLLIAKATRNSAVMLEVESLWRLRQTSPECALLLEKARTAHVKPVVEEHTAIVKALRTRNPTKARAAMRAHLSAVMEHLLFNTEQRAVDDARRSLQQAKARFGRTRA
jgi:GntR family transcriptional regulator, hexuronate regulon transcriptional repressor